MDKKEREEYKKRLKHYERLGAVKFQKLVFLVEDSKFKIIKTCFPNITKYVDKYLDWKQKRAIKKASTDEEVKEIKENTKLIKMAVRKEINEGKNRNYHMDPRRPAEIIKYLEWNKEIHKRSLTKDLILIPIMIAGTIFQVPGAVFILVWELLSALVNFECINIQNYNLCRAGRMKDVLERREKSNIEHNIEEFNEASEVIHKTIEQNEKLPTFNEILANVDNIEQLKQMRAMFKREQETRNAQKQIGGI